MSNASFFSAPQYTDREPARPKAVNPRTGETQSWTRASSFADSLKNPYGIIKWKMRDLVMGLSQRPDLCRMLLAGTPIEDKAKADEIIDQALSVMAPEAKANEGTAAHTALVRSWVHQDEQPEPEFLPLIQAFARALKEHGLTPRAAEQRVLNLTHNSMGSLDWVLEEADGMLVIGDVKTGRIDLAKREFAVQLENYDGGDYVVHPDGSVEPIPWKLAHTHAVLIHIDLTNNNAVSVYRVDLNIGRHGAGLATQLRQWHKLDPLTPYVRPVAPRGVEQSVPMHHTQTSAVEPSPNGFESQAAYNAAVAEVGKTKPRGEAFTVVAETPQETKARTAPLGGHELDQAIPAAIAAITEDDEELPSFNAAEELTVEGARDVSQQPEKPYDVGARFDEWMKLDKAPLQMELKKRGWTDISHNRRWLARALVVLEQGWTDAKAIKNFAAAKDDELSEAQALVVRAGTEAPEVGGAGVPHEPATPPADPLQGPSASTIHAAIGGANSVGAIEALRSDIVERRGDQAWDDGMVSSARVRVAELGELPISDAAGNAVLRAISLAPNQEALKDLWVRTTLGGSVPERWLPAFTELGTRRLAELAAALPPAPANPFGD